MIGAAGLHEGLALSKVALRQQSICVSFAETKRARTDDRGGAGSLRHSAAFKRCELTSISSRQMGRCLGD
jgi:hypothetical protein